jgi:hypothetical protein
VPAAVEMSAATFHLGLPCTPARTFPPSRRTTSAQGCMRVKAGAHRASVARRRSALKRVRSARLAVVDKRGAEKVATAHQPVRSEMRRCEGASVRLCAPCWFGRDPTLFRLVHNVVRSPLFGALRAPERKIAEVREIRKLVSSLCHRRAPEKGRRHDHPRHAQWGDSKCAARWTFEPATWAGTYGHRGTAPEPIGLARVSYWKRRAPSKASLAWHRCRESLPQQDVIWAFFERQRPR